MNDYREMIARMIVDAVESLEFEEVRSMVEMPADCKLGDYAFPCFKLAKVLRKAPTAIAKDIAEKINKSEIFEKVECVKAYVNIFVSRDVFTSDTLHEVNAAGDLYGRSSRGSGKKVIVEYSSPNIAKPFHIGHIRSTVIGNSVYKIYDCLGYDIVRINHLGDYGTQFGKMICAYRHWGNEKEVKKEPIETLFKYYTKFHVEAEAHTELEQEARDIFTKLERGCEEEVELWKWFREESLKELSKVYGMLGIDFDSYAGESF